MGWEGEERRSPESLMARAAVAARKEADEARQELDGIPRWEVRRRKRLKKSLQDAERRESDALFVLKNG